VGETVRYERDGAVAIITIARPEVRNAMDDSVFDGLRAMGERADADPEVRAVVVTGEGNFSSGIDTTLFGNQGDPATIDIARLQRAYSIFEEMQHPSIAAVEGPAFGGGFQLALACDFRVIAEGARLAVAEVRWGIIPDLGATVRLPRLIGLNRAKDLAMTGREIGAEEAVEIGFADRTAPAGDALKVALGFAQSLAAGPPLALRGMKRLMNGAFDRPVSDGLDLEAETQRPILASEDFIEAVTAKMQRRDPQFRAR
jgi:enoyl-CoA hydratase/carnithine racemase